MAKRGRTAECTAQCGGGPTAHRLSTARPVRLDRFLGTETSMGPDCNGRRASLFGLAAYHLMWRHPSFSIETVQFTKLTDSGGAEVAAISPNGDYIAYTKRRGE